MAGRPKGTPKTGGRKPGTPNRATAKREAEIRASGLTPLDFMLAILRDEAKPDDLRFEAAKAAAPYVHPKLSNVDHKSSDGTMTPQPNHIIIEAAIDDGSDKAAAETRPGIQ